MNKTVPIDLATDPLTRGRIEHTVGAWARFWLNFALFQNINFKPFDWVNGAFFVNFLESKPWVSKMS